jgi:hypothetical protein
MADAEQPRPEDGPPEWKPREFTSEEEQYSSDAQVAAASQPALAIAAAKSAPRSVRFYAVAAVGGGLLVGVVIAAISLSLPQPDPVTEAAKKLAWRDLGTVVATAPGLKGHLFAQWEKSFRYRLVVEPSDATLRPGFALSVSDPPRPLMVAIQLHDSSGAVFCGAQFPLKYDPARAVVGQDKQGASFAELQAEELDRERGRDLFKNDTGPDGQIVAVSAQGELPCSKRAYDDFSFWSFSPDFPTLDEQAERLNRQPENAAKPGDQGATGARKKRKIAAAVAAAPFSVEGDDAVVGFDAATGVIETASGRAFLVDKASPDANVLKGMDFPEDFHYRCDLTRACVLTHRGGAAVRARLRG